ncbi:hypothetical protein ABZ054_27630, partial [Streptomyces sp. NPDC006324]
MADDTAAEALPSLTDSSAEPFTDGYVGDPAVRDEWDNRYSERHQLWSGQPNGALVAEVADPLTPPRPRTASGPVRA